MVVVVEVWLVENEVDVVDDVLVVDVVVTDVLLYVVDIVT